MKPLRDPAMRRYSEESRRCRGVLVRQLRTEKGWSSSELSKRAGVSVQWIRKFEENRITTNYSMRLEWQIIEALGFGVMEVYQFYKRVGEMTEAIVGPSPWLRDDGKGGTP